MDWNKITDAVITIVKTGAPIAASLFPGASAAINIAEHLVASAQRGEPAAMALVNTINSNAPVSPEQLKEYADNYQISYEALNADIDRKLHELDNDGDENT